MAGVPLLLDTHFWIWLQKGETSVFQWVNPKSR